MRRFLGPLSALLLLACGDATGLLVEVSSPDLSIPADIDVLRFQATSEGGSIDRSYPLEGGWPHSLTLAPASDADQNVVITVSGLRGGAIAIRRVVQARFERGVTRRVEIVLTRDCVAVMCGPGVDCQAGRCTTTPPLQDAGVDAGMPFDGGPLPDSGPMPDAGPLPDGGGMDAGVLVDAGMTDAGMMELDGGVDAFVPAVDAGPASVTCTDGGNPCAGILVISELATEGTGGPGDEFVEIYNAGSMAVDASDVEMEYSARVGLSFGNRATLPTGTIIPPGGYYLLGSGGFSGTSDAGGGWGSGFSAGRGAVRISANSLSIDAVGWRETGSEDVQSEGTAFLSADLGGGGSYERKASSSSTATTMAPGGSDATAGNGEDTNDNSADFVLRAARGPQGSSSPTEP